MALTRRITDVGKLPIELVGDDVEVLCLDGRSRRYLSLDFAASTPALPSVLSAVNEFVPNYSSIHRGAGYKSQLSTQTYELARQAILGFVGKTGHSGLGNDISTAIICRNTTEAINHLAFRLRLSPTDTVITTVVEHHANLLPWRRYSNVGYVECSREGTFTANDVRLKLDTFKNVRLLAITGASNITGWSPDLETIITLGHERNLPVLVDCAQLAPHRQVPRDADFIVFSGHKLYAPFGGGALVGPAKFFEEGEPFLAGGGAVDLVGLDEVMWTSPPDREEAGSPNVIGAVAMQASIEFIQFLGWETIESHDREISELLRKNLAKLSHVNVLGPSNPDGLLPVVTFIVGSMPHALVAARLSCEYGIGVRHGCFCAHPYLTRLLALSDTEIEEFRQQVRLGDRSSIPGAVRVSCGLSTSKSDIERFVSGLEAICASPDMNSQYIQDPTSGEYFPRDSKLEWYSAGLDLRPCGQS